LNLLVLASGKFRITKFNIIIWFVFIKPYNLTRTC